MKPQPQFTITGLLALTASMAPAFAVIQWHDLMSWIQLGIPMVILCLIVLKFGARCLIGAAVGAVLASASLLALIDLTGSLTDDTSRRIAGLIGIAYFGAAIVGGMIGASVASLIFRSRSRTDAV
ncbi:hypothetical protein CKO51_24950 [Rhodopirellula sp. SM50]|nr:hypothetical protein CKO51_24950 [Rhodopirellula sp. SM50]